MAFRAISLFMKVLPDGIENGLDMRLLYIIY